MEYIVPIKVKYLSHTAREDDEFEERVVDINVQEDTVAIAKQRLNMAGFLVYFGTLLKDGDRFRAFFDGKEKLIAMDCGEGWEESESAARNTNSAHRIVNGGFTITHALRALGRAHWHEGFAPFSTSAYLIKKLIDESSLEDYQNRTESITVSDPGELEYVGVFNEYEESVLYFPPELGVDSDVQFIEDGRRTQPNRALGADSVRARLTQRQTVIDAGPNLQSAAKAVVRMFGFHPLTANAPEAGPTDSSHVSSIQTRRGSEANTTIDVSAISPGDISTAFGGEDKGAFLGPGTAGKRYRVIPFTAFFVTPTLLMSTRNCNYSTAYNTYAEHFAFTRKVRAVFPFLKPGTDLIKCRPIHGISAFLVDKIRSIGVEVPEDLIPPDNMAIRWSDIMLYEVPLEHQSSVYLIPDSGQITAGELLISLSYHARPSAAWMHETVGDDGIGGVKFTERDLSDHFHKFDLKCCSIGQAKADERDGFVQHMSCLLPSSIGSPILRVVGKEYSPLSRFFPFCAVNCGRSRTDIRIAEGPGGIQSSRRHNMGLAVRNLALILVYQQYVMPHLLNEECHYQLREFLRPFNILSERDRLAACHVKMLKDADEFNEFGMEFYENMKLKYALQCFREGARMFSIANIPNQSEYDRKLKDALQSNVSSVIISLKESGQITS